MWTRTLLVPFAFGLVVWIAGLVGMALVPQPGREAAGPSLGTAVYEIAPLTGFLQDPTGKYQVIYRPLVAAERRL